MSVSVSSTVPFSAPKQPNASPENSVPLVELAEERQRSRVVRLHVVNHDVVYRAVAEHAAHVGKVFLEEFRAHAVDYGRFFVVDEV